MGLDEQVKKTVKTVIFLIRICSFQIELMSLWISDGIFYLLLEKVQSKFEKYLVIYAFSTFQ
jgi:hypothetical protein